MTRTAILALLLGCAAPAKHTPDANPEQEKEQAELVGYLRGYVESEQAITTGPPAIVYGPAVTTSDHALLVTQPKPAEPVKWEDPDLQVVCWRAPEGISCLPAHTIKAKPRWK